MSFPEAEISAGMASTSCITRIPEKYLCHWLCSFRDRIKNVSSVDHRRVTSQNATSGDLGVEIQLGNTDPG
jgi:hypothetical protein